MSENSAIFEPNVDPKLSQRLAESDADALSEMDAPIEAEPKVPDHVEKVVEELKEEPEKKTEEPPKLDEPVVPKTSLTDEELKARLDEIQPKKNAHPNTAKGYEALKKVISEQVEARKEAERLVREGKEKLDALETEYKGKVITPEMEKEFEDLREMRRMYQIENDPQFRQKYDSKQQEIELRAMNILRGSDLPEGQRLTASLEKFILENGGVLAMHNSSQQMPAPYQGQTYREFIEDNLMERLSGVRKSRFEQALAAGMDLKDEMSREIELAKTQGSARQKAKQKEIEDLFRQSADATRKSFGKMAEKLDYPPNASKEEKVKIDKHNGRVAEAEKRFSEYMRDGGKSPAKLAEALAKAAQSQMLMEQMEEKDAELADRDKKIKDLEEKFEKIKKSGETGRTNSAPPPSSAPVNTGKFESDAQALDKF